MSTDTTYAIVMLLTLAVNHGTLFIVLPRKYNLRISISVVIAYTALFFTVLFLTGNVSNMFWGFRGLIHLPLLVFLFRGLLLQKLFAALMVMILTGFQMTLVSSVVETFFEYGSDTYNLLSSVIILVLFAIYFTLVFFFGRTILQKLFIRGQQTEWVLYTSGAALSHSVMMFAYNTFSGAGRIAVICFTVWSFVILCFAIINTHEKTRQAYEAKFARDIISSGRDHYQKMNELRDALRVMRHDYKYHLSAAHQLLRSGNQAEAENYLSGMEQKLSESELPDFCTNAAINALLVSYAERCSKHHIKYDMKITLPHSLTIPDYDMCIILGNLLENAVEACVKQEDKGTLKMMVSTKGIHLAIMVKNSFNGRLEPGDILPLSSKKDGGLGLKSVQAIAARYDGELITQWDEEIFTAYVLLRLFD